MAKDPASLFFIDKWFLATKEMKADCRGWYLNLILHQFDKRDLPNDIEELANLADVRISEFEQFKNVFEQVLQHKFKQKSNGRLENLFAAEIIKAREEFKEKRSDAGKISYFVKFIRTHLCQDENIIFFIKSKVNPNDIETKDENMLKHLFEQMFKLYINAIAIVNINTDINISFERFKENFSFKITEYEFMLIQQMMQIWIKHNSDYHVDIEIDFPACLKIAYKIAANKKWVQASVVNGKLDECLKEWGKIVEFIVLDKFYSSFTLENIDKHFQKINSSINATRKQTSTFGRNNKTRIQSNQSEEPL